jgi:hypothetical protein
MANDFDSDKVEVELMGTGGQVNELLDKNKLIKTPLIHTNTHAHTRNIRTHAQTRAAWPGLAPAHHGPDGLAGTAQHTTAQHSTPQLARPGITLASP